MITHYTSCQQCQTVLNSVNSYSAVLPPSLMVFLHYNIGGRGSLRTPNLYYVIYGRPLILSLLNSQVAVKIIASSLKSKRLMQNLFPQHNGNSNWVVKCKMVFLPPAKKAFKETLPGEEQRGPSENTFYLF